LMVFRNCARPNMVTELGVKGRPLLPHSSPGWLLAKNVSPPKRVPIAGLGTGLIITLKSRIKFVIKTKVITVR